MKAATKVQILFFLLIGILVSAWKFHLLPKELYGIFPVGIKSINQQCDYQRQQGSCAIFKCGKHLMRTRFSWLKIPPSVGEKFLIEGTVYFRNQKEICPGLDGQPDTYFEVDEMIRIKVQNHG